MLSPSPCGIGGLSNPSGPCVGTYSMTGIEAAINQLSSSSVIAGLLGGASILAAIGFAVFAAYLVGRFFGRDQEKRSPDELASDRIKRRYERRMARHMQREDTLSQLREGNDDAADGDVEDDSPSDEYEVT